MQKRWLVIIPAAGVGHRFGGALPKQFQDLAGSSILARTVAEALKVEGVIDVIVAVNHSMMPLAESQLGWLGSSVTIIAGGSNRQHSVALALEHTSVGGTWDLIFVHDAVRPLASPSLYSRVATAALETGAAVPVLEVTDTIKRVDETSHVIATEPRDALRRAQTPQAFRSDVLRNAFAHAAEHSIVGTDEASLVEALGQPVVTVPGDASNIKITTPQDLVLAKVLLDAPSRPL